MTTPTIEQLGPLYPFMHAYGVIMGYDSTALDQELRQAEHYEYPAETYCIVTRNNHPQPECMTDLVKRDASHPIIEELLEKVAVLYPDNDTVRRVRGELLEGNPPA
jgi:hypothetical protein